MEVPANRCGFVANETAGERGGLCCWRPVWKEGRCVWHANVEEKPIDTLVESRLDGPERLDGVILRNLELDGTISFAYSSLSGADLSRAKLSEVDFTSADLTGADFSGATLSGVKLPRANLSKARLSNSDFSGAYLPEANLQEANLNFSDFSGTVLSRSDISSAKGDSVNFREASLQKANFTDGQFVDADFRSAKLRSADFTKARLTGSKFTESNLEYAKLADVHADESTFSQSNLRNSDLSDSTFLHADFSSARASQVDFRRAKLYGAILSGMRIDVGTTFDFEPDADADLDRQISTYYDLATVLRTNGLHSGARRAHVARKRLERILARERKDYLRYLSNFINELSSLYGQSASRVVSNAIFVILTFALLYTALDEPLRAGSSVLRIGRTDVAVPSLLAELVDGIVLSISAFAFGRQIPVESGRYLLDILVSLESLLGAFYFALFVFVVGRKMLME